ncbi:MAG: sulfate reduction electron transfer complex DsrMKJOP subunit DsrO [Bacillota bacterium]
MPRYGMLVDIDKCTMCQACTISCKAENNIPDGMFWGQVRTVPNNKPYPDYRVTPLPMPCMHCDDAPCVNACPVSATYKRPDGIVAIDYDKCIGCKYCIAACPYGARTFNKETAWVEVGGKPGWYNAEVPIRPRGVVEKCTFCSHRIDAGNMTPACVAACPSGARFFGDLDDPNSEVAKQIEANKARQLRPELGAQPKCFYAGLPGEGR